MHDHKQAKSSTSGKGPVLSNFSQLSRPFTVQAQAKPAPSIKTQLENGRRLGNSLENPALQANNAVVQLSPGDELLEKVKDKKRQLIAKSQKKKYDILSNIKGVVKGKGGASKYEEFNRPTEEHFYDDLLEEESKSRQRWKDNPIENALRTVTVKAGKKLIGEGAELAGEAMGAPGAGTALGKVASKPLEKLDKKWEERLDTGRHYQPLRENPQYEDEDSDTDEEDE